MSQVFDTPKDIRAFQQLAQYHACKLQLLGLRHSSGLSIIAHVKRTYGFKGTNKSVVEQFKQQLITRRDHQGMRTVRSVIVQDPYSDPVLLVTRDSHRPTATRYSARIGETSEVISHQSLAKLFRALARRAEKGDIK